MNDSTDAPAYSRTRITGMVWLLYFVISSVGLAVMRGVIGHGDAARTASNLVAHNAQFQVGAGFDLVGNCVYIVLTVLLYRVFRRVDPNLALLATVFSLMGCAVQIFGALFRIGPFVMLVDNQAFAAFSTQQLQAAALFSLRMFSRVFSISFVLFGFFEIVLGYLILKSTFLPRWLGWLFIVAGIGGLTFLWPPLATSIFPFIVAFGIAELILAIWLIVKGPAIDRLPEQNAV